MAGCVGAGGELKVFCFFSSEKKNLALPFFKALISLNTFPNGHLAGAS
jgi:hypothetical protein